MMKYTVRSLYIREAIIFGNLQNYKTVKWDEIHHGNESDGKETLGDSLTKDSLWCKDFDFPKLPVFFYGLGIKYSGISIFCSSISKTAFII